MTPCSEQSWKTSGEYSCSHSLLLCMSCVQVHSGLPVFALPSVDSECSVVSEDHRVNLAPILVR